MKKLIVLFVIIVTGLVAASTGAEAAVYEPKILASDAQKIIVEFTAPPLTVQPVVTREVSGQVIMMSGFSQTADPGAPQLPVQGYAIAVPENARPTLQILEQEVEVRTIPDIVPAPKMKKEIVAAIPDETAVEARIASTQPVQDETQYVYERDAEIYASNTFYPSEPVVIGSEAILRDVRLITVQLYPVQYNAAQNRAKVYKRLKFAVYFNGGSTAASAWSEQNSSPAFEDVYRSVLLNYEQSKAFRIDRRQLRKAAQDDYFLSQGSEWYKITLEKPGIYYITRADLEAAGMNLTGVDPRKFRMFNKGVEIAVNVIGEEDGSFDSGDQIEFYGTAFKNYYTTTNVYWLTVGSVNGKRMEVKDGTLTGSFPVHIRGQRTYHYETDVYRAANYPGHTDNERWFDNYIIAPAERTYTKVLANVSDTTTSDCKIIVRLQGITDDQNVNPDHRTIISLNNNEIINELWEGRTEFLRSAQISQSLFINGTNSLVMNGPGNTGAGSDIQYIDYYEYLFWQDFKTSNDSLFFRVQTTNIFQCHLQGFSSANIKIFDISDSTNLKRVDNFTFSNGHIWFQDSASSIKRYLALTDAQRNKPTITKDNLANLRSTQNRADYLFITHSLFKSQLQRLADYRSNQGFTCKIIDVQDIYDEFNYGYYQEKAIKYFLGYVYQNWSTPLPSFVVLVGDASFNPRTLRPSYWGSAQSDFVPTRLFEAVEANFEAASDNWFGSVSGNDNLPEFLIGRLTPRTEYEAQIMVEKIINYEINFKSGDWNKTSLFVADNNEESFAFTDSSDAFQRDLIPTYFIKKKAYLSDYGTAPATKAAIIDAVNRGVLIVNYYGHGSIGTWAQEKILEKTDIPSFRNDNKLNFLLTLSCINGYFVDPRESNISIAEEFLRQRQRGGINVFSGAGEAYPSPVLAMGRAAYKSLFQDRVRRVGSFTLAGLVRMASAYPSFPDHVMFYLVFGDPSTELHYQPSQVAASAGYQGVLMLQQAPAPPGTGIVATIQKKVYAADIVGEKGAFGPLQVLADDPETPEKDGGAPGDRVVFYAVVGKDTLALTPAYEWKAGEIQQVKLQPAATSVDQLAEIALYADDKKYGEEWIDGDCLAKTATLTAHITPRRGALDASSVQIVVDGEPLSFEQYRVTTVQEAGPKLTATLSLNVLPDGEHEIKVQVIGESAQAEQTARFALQSKLSLKDVVNFPNPMKEETKFTFTLQNDRPAEIEIKLYTIAGRLIRTFKQTVSVGYNEIPWDGQDAEGDELANGLYFYKIIADDGEEKAEVTERLVVMK